MNNFPSSANTRHSFTSQHPSSSQQLGKLQNSLLTLHPTTTHPSTAHPSRAHLYTFLRPQPPPIHNSPVHSSPLRSSPFHSSPVHNHSIHNSPIHCSPIHNSCRWRKASVGSGGLLFCYLKNGLKIRNLHRKLRQEIENNSM